MKLDYFFFKPNYKTISAILIFVFCISISMTVNAQSDTITPVKRSHVNNIIKLNMASLLIGGLSFQDEVYFNSNVSGAIGFNYTIPGLFLPKTFLPDNDETGFGNVKVSGFSITPECRIYIKSLAPKGFYVAPYFRFSKYKIDGIKITYDADDGSKKTAFVKGTYDQSAGGIMIGKQSRMGSHLVLDWWIFGGAYGSGKYVLSGTGNFTQKEQQDIIDDTPKKILGAPTVRSVSSSEINISYKAPFSVRMGFLIGYIF